MRHHNNLVIWGYSFPSSHRNEENPLRAVIRSLHFFCPTDRGACLSSVIVTFLSFVCVSSFSLIIVIFMLFSCLNQSVVDHFACVGRALIVSCPCGRTHPSLLSLA